MIVLSLLILIYYLISGAANSRSGVCGNHLVSLDTRSLSIPVNKINEYWQTTAKGYSRINEHPILGGAAIIMLMKWG